MDWKIKSIIVGVIALIFCVLAYIIKVQQDTISKLKTIEASVVEAKDIGNGISRAQSNYVSKDQLEKIIKDNKLDLSAIQKDMDNLNANVNGLYTVVATSKPIYIKGAPSDEQTAKDPTVPAPVGQDPFGYMSHMEWKDIAEDFGNGKTIPIGKLGFEAYKPAPWTVSIVPREYKVATVLGVDEEGRSYAYSKFSIVADGKDIDIPIKANLSQVYPDPKFSFNPHIFLGFDIGMLPTPPTKMDGIASLGIGLFSYGKTKIDPDFTFLILGVGYSIEDQVFAGNITPATYNIAKHIPLMSSLNIGPSVSYDTKGRLGLMFGIKVAL